MLERDNDGKNKRTQTWPHRIFCHIKRKTSEKQQCVRSNALVAFTIGEYNIKISSRLDHINVLLLILTIGRIGQ